MNRRLRLALAFCLGAATIASAVEDAGTEEVRVERALIDVRVLARDGRPVTGLGPANFAVSVDGRAAEVTSVDWFPGLEVAADSGTPPAAAPGPAPGPAAGRGSTTVLFFQRSLEPARLAGLVRALGEARRYVAAMRPGDRVAILAHEYRLHLLADLTSDRERLLALMDTWARFGSLEGAAPGGAGEEPVLARTLTPDVLRQAAQVETALLRVGEALEAVPGPKDIVFFAWGMGRFGRDGVSDTRDFKPAIAALRRARACLLTIDVLQADWHSLEGPLREAARDTGGVYVKSYPLQTPLATVRAAAAGRYVLALKRPAGDEKGRLRVRLVGASGEVLAPDRLPPRS